MLFLIIWRMKILLKNRENSTVMFHLGRRDQEIFNIAETEKYVNTMYNI